MIKTPVQKAIDNVSKQIEFYKDRKHCYSQESVNDYVNSENILTSVLKSLQSLLPVEQQFNCEFAEWVGNKGWYWNIDIQKYKKWEDETRVFATTTELLQLFTNQNQGK